MNEFTRVISSTGLPNGPEPTRPNVLSPCPKKEYLGLSCSSSSGYAECICTMVESAEFKVHRNEAGKALAVSLRMELPYLTGRTSAQQVFDEIGLTGLVADFSASHTEVYAVFQLRKPQNIAIMENIENLSNTEA